MVTDTLRWGLKMEFKNLPLFMCCCPPLPAQKYCLIPGSIRDDDDKDVQSLSNFRFYWLILIHKKLAVIFQANFWIIATNLGFSFLSMFHLAYLGIMFGGDTELQERVRKYIFIGAFIYWSFSQAVSLPVATNCTTSAWSV